MVVKNSRSKTRVKNTMQDVTVPDGSISVHDYLNIGSSSSYRVTRGSATGTIELPLNKSYGYGDGFNAVVDISGASGPSYGCRVILQKRGGSSILNKITTLSSYGESYVNSITYKTDSTNPGVPATKIIIEGLNPTQCYAVMYMN